MTPEELVKAVVEALGLPWPGQLRAGPHTRLYLSAIASRCGELRAREVALPCPPWSDWRSGVDRAYALEGLPKVAVGPGPFALVDGLELWPSNAAVVGAVVAEGVAMLALLRAVPAERPLPSRAWCHALFIELYVYRDHVRAETMVPSAVHPSAYFEGAGPYAQALIMLSC